MTGWYQGQRAWDWTMREMGAMEWQATSGRRQLIVEAGKPTARPSGVRQHGILAGLASLSLAMNGLTEPLARSDLCGWARVE